MKYTKHTHYHLQGHTDQYISVNNFLGIKFCLAVEPTSEGSVSFCGLFDEACGLCLWDAVGAGKGHGGVIPG